MLPDETDLGVDIDKDGDALDPVGTDQRGEGQHRIDCDTVDAGTYEYTVGVSDALPVLQILTSGTGVDFIDFDNNGQAETIDAIGIMQCASETR